MPPNLTLQSHTQPLMSLPPQANGNGTSSHSQSKSNYKSAEIPLMTQGNSKSGTSTTRPLSTSQRTVATCFWGTQVALCLFLVCTAIVQGSTVLIVRASLSHQMLSVMPLLTIFILRSDCRSDVQYCQERWFRSPLGNLKLVIEDIFDNALRLTVEYMYPPPTLYRLIQTVIGLFSDVSRV